MKLNKTIIALVGILLPFIWNISLASVTRIQINGLGSSPYIYTGAEYAKNARFDGNTWHIDNSGGKVRFWIWYKPDKVGKKNCLCYVKVENTNTFDPFGGSIFEPGGDINRNGTVFCQLHGGSNPADYSINVLPQKCN